MVYNYVSFRVQCRTHNNSKDDHSVGGGMKVAYLEEAYLEVKNRFAIIHRKIKDFVPHDSKSVVSSISIDAVWIPRVAQT